MKMVALKRFKYPYGLAGKEYRPGDMLTALSERDAKGLYISGRAMLAEKATPHSPADLPKAAMKNTRQTDQQPGVPPPGESRRRYQCRDMTAGDGQTGAATSPPSSRRGRPRSEPTSPPSEDGAE